MDWFSNIGDWVSQAGDFLDRNKSWINGARNVYNTWDAANTRQDTRNQLLDVYQQTAAADAQYQQDYYNCSSSKLAWQQLMTQQEGQQHREQQA